MKAVNLLPPDLRGASKKPAAASAATPPKPASGGAGPFVVLGVLAFAVVAVTAYVLTGNTIKDRKAELAAVKQQHGATIAQANALKPYADFATMATARVATVQTLAQSRFDWEQALRDVSRALPSYVHLTKLRGDLAGAEGGGTGSSALRGALPAPAIELTGCTESHSNVARMMSRLRNVRGVTRVSLASSDKEASGGTATTTAPIADADGKLPAQTCPKGAPPSFEVVVFFENSAATAETGATPGPSATPTPAPGATATPAPGGVATEPASTDPTGASTTPASATEGAK